MAMEASIVRSARAMVGVRFKLGGRSLKGVDCAGLIYVIASSHGLSMPVDDFNSYARSNRKSHVLSQMRGHFVRETRHRPGMLLVVSLTKTLAHLAILVTPSEMVHASNEKNVMRVVKTKVDWSVVAGVFSFKERAA